jgi:hypothetical protein
MSNKKSVIKLNSDGQFFHQSGASMGSMSAAGDQAHRTLTANAKKHSMASRNYSGGGFVLGKPNPGGSPQNSSAQFQKHALAARAHAAGSKASPSQLKASSPGDGLSYGKTVTVLKGGKRKRRTTRKHKKRRSKKSAKRFRKGGQPWGCYSGGRKSKRRRQTRKRSKKY